MTQKQEIAKADHRRQQIVEIMGDTARQLAHGLHFLGLCELFFEAFAPGRIDQVDDHVGGDAAGLLDGAGMELGGAFARTGDSNFESVRMGAATRFGQSFRNLGAVVLENKIHERGLRANLFGADHAAKGNIGFNDFVTDVDHDDADRGFVEEPARTRGPAAVAEAPGAGMIDDQPVLGRVVRAGCRSGNLDGGGKDLAAECTQPDLAAFESRISRLVGLARLAAGDKIEQVGTADETGRVCLEPAGQGLIGEHDAPVAPSRKDSNRQRIDGAAEFGRGNRRRNAARTGRQYPQPAGARDPAPKRCRRPIRATAARRQRPLWRRALPAGAGLAALLVLWLAEPAAAQQLSLDLGSETGPLTGRLLQLVALVTVIALAPSLLVVVTSFTRIVVVLSLLRSAMGVQQTPPNTVLIGLALFLTAYVMAPTFESAYQNGILPLLNDEINEPEALERVAQPIHTFMLSQVREQDLGMFLELTGLEFPENPEATPWTALVPAFMISELKRTFEIGFMIFIPFIIIDMVVASVLMSMGMMMLPPILISLPFKLIFFVLVDGWNLVTTSLVLSFT